MAEDEWPDAPLRPFTVSIDRLDDAMDVIRGDAAAARRQEMNRVHAQRFDEIAALRAEGERLGALLAADDEGEQTAPR